MVQDKAIVTTVDQ